MSKESLLDLSDRLSMIEQTIKDLEGEEIPEELKVALDDLLSDKDSAKEKYVEKINNILLLIKSREAWVKIRKDRIDELRKLIKTDENLVVRLKKYLLDHLLEQNTKNLRTQDFNISVAKTGGANPIVIKKDIDLETVPQEYLKINKSVDKQAIAQALKKGKTLDFAHEGTRNNHLRIK